MVAFSCELVAWLGVFAPVVHAFVPLPRVLPLASTNLPAVRMASNQELIPTPPGGGDGGRGRGAGWPGEGGSDGDGKNDGRDLFARPEVTVWITYLEAILGTTILLHTASPGSNKETPTSYLIAVGRYLKFPVVIPPATQPGDIIEVVERNQVSRRTLRVRVDVMMPDPTKMDKEELALLTKIGEMWKAKDGSIFSRKAKGLERLDQAPRDM